MSHSLTFCDTGFVQVVTDKFFANISYPNGLEATHNTGIPLTQQQGLVEKRNTFEGNKI